MSGWNSRRAGRSGPPVPAGSLTLQTKPDVSPVTRHAPPPTKFALPPVRNALLPQPNRNPAFPPAPAPRGAAPIQLRPATPAAPRPAVLRTPPPPPSPAPVVQRWQAVTGAVAAHPWISAAVVVGGLLAAGAYEVSRRMYDRRLQSGLRDKYREIATRLGPVKRENLERVTKKAHGQSILLVAKDEMVRDSAGKAHDVARMMRGFGAVCRRLSFSYDPNIVDCESVAAALSAGLDELGIANDTVLIGQSADERVVVRAPDPIDRSWNGGPVYSAGGQRIAGWLGFDNHWGVKVGGTVYDPTGGYVGGEDGWYILLKRDQGTRYALAGRLPGHDERAADVGNAGSVTQTRLVRAKAKTR